jgi:drug/metabolite transporter (DMT)-like permease
MSSKFALRVAFSKISAPLRGAAWMLASCACFSAVAAVARHLAAEFHPFETAFFRSLFQFVFMLPWLWYAGLGALRTRRLATHALRALAGLCGMLCWFAAFSLMPIAEAIALSFTTPLFCTLGASVLLGEIVGPRRWLATVVGFMGALVILRPGLEAITLPAVLMLVGSAFMAGALLLVKSLSRSETASATVLFSGLLMLPFSVVPAFFVWSEPSGGSWPWLVGLGLLATFGSLTLFRAFAVVDATVVLPFDFSRLIFAALLGSAFFGERPDLWTWLGAAVIFGASLYAVREETRMPDSIRPAAQPVADTAVPILAKESGGVDPIPPRTRDEKS